MIRFAVITLAICTLIPSTPAFAQNGGPRAPRQADELKAARPHSIRQSVANYDFTFMPTLAASQPAFQPSSVRRERSMARKVFGGVLGATAGLFAGGYLGAVIEGDRCQCDDPGLQGALIGAPIGTVVGAILGFKIF